MERLLSLHGLHVTFGPMGDQLLKVSRRRRVVSTQTVGGLRLSFPAASPAGQSLISSFIAQRVFPSFPAFLLNFDSPPDFRIARLLKDLRVVLF